MKKLLTLFAATLLFVSNSLAQDPMILIFDTNLSDGTTITLPLNGTVNVTVNWGDGTEDTYTTAGNKDHTYDTDGEYTVSITGALTQFGNAWETYSNADKLVRVTSFGNLGLTSLSGAFRAANNLIEVPGVLPSTVTNMSYMFNRASSFNQNIGNWDVSRVTNMSFMFRVATAFNQPIGDWDVSIVTNMGSMFLNAPSFNQDIESWDVSKVTDMSGMFYGAISFNQPIGDWNVSSVTLMWGMFSGAISFNQPIGDWDVSKVKAMQSLFYNAKAFNQDIGGWDVSRVTYMYSMFESATSFNQPIGDWDVSSVTDMTDMFRGVTLSTANYNHLLEGWGAQTLKSGVTFHGGSSKYSAGEPSDARQHIIDTFGWTITDGGVSNLPAVATAPVTDITPTSSTSGGEVSNNGGSDVTARGVVWHTESNPTIANNVGLTSNGDGLGSFSSSLSSLDLGTTYHVKAYATNENGTDYGPSVSFAASQELNVSGEFTAASKEYDGSPIATLVYNYLTLNNVLDEQHDIHLTNPTIAFDNKDSGNDKTVHIESISLIGDDSNKYYLVLSNAPTATANITPKSLSLNGIYDVLPKAYDGTTAATLEGEPSLEGIIEGEENGVSIASVEANFAQSTPGYTIGVDIDVTLEGEESPNYTVEEIGWLEGIITPKELTIGGSFTANDKVHDGTDVAEIDENNLTLVGIIADEAVNMFNIYARFAQVEVGSDILVSIYTAALEGDDKDNYSLTLVGSPTTTASITYPTSVNHGTLSNLRVYPNPFNNHIYFEAEENITQVIITSVTGQVILAQQLNGEQLVSVGNLPSGVYLVTVELKGGLKKVLRMVRQ